MPDVCQDQPIFCLEEIVVFVVSGDIYIGSLSYCGRSEEGTGTAADGYFPDLRFTDCSVTDDFTTESLFYLLQERQTIGWLGEFADDSETRYRIGIIQVNDVPYRFFSKVSMLLERRYSGTVISVFISSSR